MSTPSVWWTLPSSTVEVAIFVLFRRLVIGRLFHPVTPFPRLRPSRGLPSAFLDSSSSRSSSLSSRSPAASSPPTLVVPWRRSSPRGLASAGRSPLAVDAEEEEESVEEEEDGNEEDGSDEEEKEDSEEDMECLVAFIVSSLFLSTVGI